MRRFQRQACSVGLILSVIGACSAPDRDYSDPASGAGSGGGAGKLSVISGGRAGGPGKGGAAGDGGVENVGGAGAPPLSGGTGAVSGASNGGASGAGAGGVAETGGAGGAAGELNANGGLVEPGAGGRVTGAGGRVDMTTGGRTTGDPCATVVCTSPPAVTCASADTVRKYGAGICNAGVCEYAPTDTKCATNELCVNGACSVCATDTQCGPSCSACANGGRCKSLGTSSACVQCLTSRDCGNATCDLMTNRCVQGQSLLLTNQTSILKFDAVKGTALGVFASGGGLSLAYGLAFGPNGHLYVADFSGNAIREYDGTTGAYLASPVATKSPYDVAFGPDGNMYVGIAGGTITRYTPAGASLGTFIPAISGADFGGFRFSGTDLFVSYIGTAGALVRYDAKGGRVATIYDTFSGNGPRAASFALDGTLFVPEWQTPYVKAFASSSYKFLGNFITDRELSPNSVGFGLDGNLIVLSDTGNASSVRRYDAATGAFLGVLVPPGSGGLGRSTRMLVVAN